jgi:protein TonB
LSTNRKWQHFDVAEQDPDESRLRKWLPIAGAAALVMVLSGGAVAVIRMMSGTAAPQQPLVQQISIVLPPPPPPPPKIEQPEPEEVKIDEPEPEPLADDSSQDAPGDELGLDAEGVAGGDAFGLLAKKGGRGLLGDGDPFAWYAGLLQRDLQTALSDDDAIRSLGEYAVVVSIRLSPDGYIQDSRLLSGSNNPQLDAALRQALAAGVRISREPPEDLPQPIRLRISSRG